METSVTRTADGWRVQGFMQTKGSVPVSIVNLDLLYDAKWFGRWMTMEMKQPDNVIIHVAVGRTTAQTDVVRPTEARFQSNSVSPNTILIPERAYGAYEAVAARLSSVSAVADLPLFVAPIGETRAIVEAVTREQVTPSGSITATHYILTEIRARPTRVDLGPPVAGSCGWTCRAPRSQSCDLTPGGNTESEVRTKHEHEPRTAHVEA